MQDLQLKFLSCVLKEKLAERIFPEKSRQRLLLSKPYLLELVSIDFSFLGDIQVPLSVELGGFFDTRANQMLRRSIFLDKYLGKIERFSPKHLVGFRKAVRFQQVLNLNIPKPR